MPKVILFNLFILEIYLILECSSQISHSYFWPCATKKKKKNWLIFIYHEFILICKRSGYFILLWRYNWLKNPAVWEAESILAHVSGTIFSPNMGFMQEHSKWYKFSLQDKFSENKQIFQKILFLAKSRLIFLKVH